MLTKYEMKIFMQNLWKLVIIYSTFQCTRDITYILDIIKVYLKINIVYK